MRIFFSPLLRACALLPVLAGLVHCGSSDDTTATPSEGHPANDAGSPDGDDDDGDGDPNVPGSGSDGGTIDIGEDADAPITVCGGSKGNPHAVPLLDWNIYTKTMLVGSLGMKVPSDKDPEVCCGGANSIVTGDIVRDATTHTAGGVGGTGPFKTAVFSRNDFAGIMPKTDMSIPTLGWTNILSDIYDIRTKFVQQPGGSGFFIGGMYRYQGESGWSLIHPKKTDWADDSMYYAESIQSSRAQSWFLTLVFDHACKADIFRSMVEDGNAVSILDTSGKSFTRAEMSKFLVDNDARLFLTVFRTGPTSNDKNVAATLKGTQASAGSLDTLETTLTALTSVLQSDWDHDAPPTTYENLTKYPESSWVIGSIRGRRVGTIPPTP